MNIYVYVRNEGPTPIVVRGRRENTLLEPSGQTTAVPARDWANFEQSEFGARFLAEGNLRLVERPSNDENAADDERSAR